MHYSWLGDPVLRSWWCITRSDELWCITMPWAVMHHSNELWCYGYHAVGCDAITRSHQNELSCMSCHGTVMHHQFWTSCDALPCHGTVMHHSFWTSCDALRSHGIMHPRHSSFSSERVMASLILNEPWCITMPWAMMPSLVLMNEPWCIDALPCMLWWRIIVFHKYICSAYVWKQMASIASWCIGQSWSSKMTHAHHSFGHASFWTKVIGRSMAHNWIEQKYLIITNYTYFGLLRHPFLLSSPSTVAILVVR